MSIEKHRRRAKQIAGLLALLVFSVWVIPCHAAQGQLDDEFPVPDWSLAALVANIDYPQQSRIDAMTRVARQCTDEDMAERAEWFISIAENVNAPYAVRAHALDSLRVVSHVPEHCWEWLITVMGDEAGDEDWRTICLSRMGSMIKLADVEARNEVIAVIRAVASVQEGRVSAVALTTLAAMSEQEGSLREPVMEIVNSVVFGGQADGELILAAVQAAAGIGDASVLSKLRSIVLDETVGFRLRMSAVGMLGEFGEASDAAIIIAARDSSPLLSKVSENALARMQERLSE